MRAHSELAACGRLEGQRMVIGSFWSLTYTLRFAKGGGGHFNTKRKWEWPITLIKYGYNCFHSSTQTLYKISPVFVFCFCHCEGKMNHTDNNCSCMKQTIAFSHVETNELSITFCLIYS